MKEHIFIGGEEFAELRVQGIGSLIPEVVNNCPRPH